MNKKSVKTVMVVAMLVAVSFYFIGGTYARYTESFDGSASIDVAKWAVKLTEAEGGEETTLENLEFAVQANTNVVPGKIAPDVTAKAKAQIDLTGTEVAVDVIAEANESELQQKITALGANPADIKVTATVTSNGEAIESIQGQGSEDSPFVIPLQSNAAFTGENGKLDIEITIAWTDAGGSHDAEDTAAGEKAATSETKLEVPFKLTVRQHLD